MARKRFSATPRRSWRRAPKRAGMWAVDELTGSAAVGSGLADNDPIFSNVDYEFGDAAQKEKVRVKRIILDLFWTANGVNATDGASFMLDLALVVSGSTEMANITTNALTISGLLLVPVRVIRSRLSMHQEADQATAVGAWQPMRGPSWRVNIKTNFVMTEPENLYLYQRKQDVDSTSDAYEYSYRSRVYWEHLS